MTKLVIVSKNENGLIEIDSDNFQQIINDAQKEAYDEGLQIGFLKGQSSVLMQQNKPHECHCKHDDDASQGECHND